MLSKMARPQRMDLRIEAKLLSRIIKSELSLATSQPDPITRPTLAFFNTSESVIESPAIATIPPLCLSK